MAYGRHYRRTWQSQSSSQELASFEAMQCGDSSTGFGDIDMKPTKFPAREWLLTQVGESLFTLTPEEYVLFQLFTKAFYATDTKC